MRLLGLHQFHASRDARFGDCVGEEIVLGYGDPLLEHQALRTGAGLLDLSSRGRLCVLGADRVRFLHGQVTNDVKSLTAGRGCYAALITAKGRMVSDLNIYALEHELLLDLEPGFASTVTERLEKYIIADDVQLVDASAGYGLLSVQGPRAAELVDAAQPGVDLPRAPMSFTVSTAPDGEEVYVMNQPRFGSSGFDLFVPVAAMTGYAERFEAVAAGLEARWCGWEAAEIARVEAGVPRFGIDMDETNLPPEAGLDERAVSYAKGCYIGQEVLSRIRTYGQVARALRGLRLADDLLALPLKGDLLLKDGKEVGRITSAVRSLAFHANLALGYVRRETNAPGTALTLRTVNGDSTARIVNLPFDRQENFA